MITQQNRQLAKQYLPYVKRIAADVRKALPYSVEFGDLEGYGALGLMEAAERFEPDRGMKFNTFSHYRIKGAMLDGLRNMGLFGPAAYRHIAKLRQDAENLPEEEKAADLSEAPRPVGIPLDSVSERDFWDNSLSAEDILIRQEERRTVRELINELPPREKTLLALHYFEGMNLKQAGEKLGISKSRACRIHKRAIARLRDIMTAKEAE